MAHDPHKIVRRQVVKKIIRNLETRRIVRAGISGPAGPTGPTGPSGALTVSHSTAVAMSGTARVDTLLKADVASAKWLVTVTDPATDKRGGAEVHARHDTVTPRWTVAAKDVADVSFTVAVVIDGTAFAIELTNTHSAAVDMSAVRIETEVPP